MRGSRRSLNNLVSLERGSISAAAAVGCPDSEFKVAVLLWILLALLQSGVLGLFSFVFRLTVRDEEFVKESLLY